MFSFRSAAVAVLIACAGALSAFGQSRHDVVGTVTDSTEVGLQGATVVLLAPTDSTIVKFAVTGQDGGFTIPRVEPGSYIFQVTFVGFEIEHRDIEVAGADLDLGAIELIERTEELGELVVNADHIPMMVRGDTLDFNADAFGAPPNSNVEELLRRIPGVEVEDDGSIKAGGEDVDKVLVDGKEFFGSDPKVATRNLPANAVDRVQVYDRQSDMAEFTGVDDGERNRTINLGLKEDARNGHFGNISGAAGADGRYDGRASLNRFSPTTQLSFIGGANNVNRSVSQGFGGFGFGGGRFISFGGGFGGGGTGNGITETLSGGLNFNREFSERTSLRSSYFLDSRENLLLGTEQQQQLLGSNVSSLINQDTENVTRNLSHRLDLNLDQKIAEGQDLRFRGNFNLSFSDDTRRRSRQTLGVDSGLRNSSSTLYLLDGRRAAGGASLTYRNRITDRGTTLVVNGEVDLNDSEEDANLASEELFFDSGDLSETRLTNQVQENFGDRLQNTQEVSVSHPLGKGRLVEVNAERREILEDQAKSIFDVTGDVPVLDSNLSSGFDRTYSYLLAGANFNRTRDKTTFNVGFDVQESTLDGDIRGRDEAIGKSFTHLLPHAGLRYSIRQGMRVNLSYRTSTREPSMRELQPFADNSDPLNVYVGNPDLRPEYHHSLRVNYSFFDAFTFRNVFLFGSVSYTDDKIVASRSFDERFTQTSTSVNSGGEWSATGAFHAGTPIRPIRAMLRFSNRTTYSSGSEIINGETNDTDILRNTVGFRLGNRYKERFDLEARTNLTFNVNRYSLNPELDQSYVNTQYVGSATWYIGESWQVSTEMDYKVFSKEVFGETETVPMWNASVTRYLMDTRVEVELLARDLLDESVGVDFSSTANTIRQSEYNALGRYLMMRVKFNLSPVRR